MKRNKLGAILRSRRGVSLPFVLATMMLLTAIGISALAAASAASGTTNNQRMADRLELYADSLQKTMMYSLQQGETAKNVNDTKTLGGQMMKYLFTKAQANQTLPYSITMDAPTLGDAKLDGTNSSVLCKLTISVEPQVTIREKYTETYYDTDADGNITEETITYPTEATLTAQVSTIAEFSWRKKHFFSATSYEYTGGFLQGDGNDPEKMLIKNPGDWRFVSYDKLDKAPK